ncbi:MAG: DinB family protein [Acidimicrobiales bacterium]
MEFSLEKSSHVLRRTPQTLDAMLRGLPEEWLHSSEEATSWTPYQVVVHLTYVEENDWIDRTRVILDRGATRVFRPVDRESGFTHFHGVGLPDLLERFAGARRVNLLSLDELVGENDLNRTGLHPDFGEVTLSQLLATWVVHDLNHLNQISKTMAKQYSQAVGPWRAFLPIIDAP